MRNCREAREGSVCLISEGFVRYLREQKGGLDWNNYDPFLDEHVGVEDATTRSRPWLLRCWPCTAMACPCSRGASSSRTPLVTGRRVLLVLRPGKRFSMLSNCAIYHGNVDPTACPSSAGELGHGQASGTTGRRFILRHGPASLRVLAASRIAHCSFHLPPIAVPKGTTRRSLGRPCDGVGTSPRVGSYDIRSARTRARRRRPRASHAVVQVPGTPTGRAQARTTR